jgi:FKBP-type peptidyl-prolyl cis-trans isomerase 2
LKRIIFFVFLSLLLAGCVSEQKETPIEEENGEEGLILVVENGDTIKVDYRGTLEDGTQFDTSVGRTPLEFTAGAGQMIKGFDEAVIGMKLNEEKTVTLSPEKAYGSRNEELIQTVSLSVLEEAEIEAKVGTTVMASTGARGTIIEVTEENALIDFNHELAGKTLTFWIKVVDIQKK